MDGDLNIFAEIIIAQFFFFFRQMPEIFLYSTCQIFSRLLLQQGQNDGLSDYPDVSREEEARAICARRESKRSGQCGLPS